jgi:alkanesulfonate monooxygenase SsuD/methylene tetrahydromethanopterin reductase-like flavin-dependent oxidoreductase (luciferase family)
MAGITVTEKLWATVADGDEPVQPVGFAEQLATIARLSHELADANTQAAWFESQLDGIRRSRPYRIGKAVLNPARVVAKRVRRRAG